MVDLLRKWEYIVTWCRLLPLISIDIQGFWRLRKNHDDVMDEIRRFGRLRGKPVLTHLLAMERKIKKLKDRIKDHDLLLAQIGGKLRCVARVF